MTAADAILDVRDVGKTFTLHVQHGARIPVLEGVGFAVHPGEAVALLGPSGAGKSTLMRMLYGNYRCDVGAIRVRHNGGRVDLGRADARAIVALRRDTIGYVSQFLRVIPRVPTRQVVAEPLRARGVAEDEAQAKAEALLARLNIPESLWDLSPVTFSGGEQQRVNIARGFAAPYPLLLLDEPTASLDAKNRQTVVDMIREAREGGAAIIGIFHDERVRAEVCTRMLDLTQYGVAG